jgi:hypothetical protein
MEAVAVSLGIVPYLSGRTTLALGILLAWFAMRGVFAEGEFSPRAIALGIAAGFGSIAVQAIVTRVRELLVSLFDPVREFMRRLDLLYVTVAAMAVTAYMLGMLGSLMAGAVSQSTASGSEVLVAGLTSEALIVLGVGGLAYTFARLRAWLADLFDQLPLSEELGVRRVLLFAESLLTLAGLVVALVLPLVGVFAMLLLLALLVGLGGLLRRVARGGHGACAGCGGMLHLAAQACRHCGASRVPRRIGMLGRVLDGSPADIARHQLSLLASRRCPSCAERLVHKQGHTSCSGCGSRAFRDPDEARAFVHHADRRIAVLAALFALLGLVPVIGLAVALVLWKLSASGALSAFSGWRGRLSTRIVQGLTLFALAALQSVPIGGALAALAAVAVKHLWARRSFLASELRENSLQGAAAVENRRTA